MIENRTWLCAGLMALVVVGAIFVLPPIADAAKPPAPSPVTYEMQLVTNPNNPGGYYDVFGMNNHGDILTVHWNMTGPCVRYADGTWVSVVDLPGGVEIVASPELANYLDLEVAYADALYGPGHTWSDVFLDAVINATQFSNYLTHALNDSGQAVGFLKFPKALNVIERRVFRYTFPRPIKNELGEVVSWTAAQFTDLGVPSGCLHAQPNAINNHGDVAGTATLPTGATAPYLWRVDSFPDTTPHERDGVCAPGEYEWEAPVESLACSPDGAPRQGSALDVNDWGQVTGEGLAEDGKLHAFRFTPGDTEPYEDLGVLVAGGSTRGSAINDAGHVAGWSMTATGATHHAFFYPDVEYPDRMKDLGTLGGRSLRSWAKDINNGLDIYGQANPQVIGYSDISTKTSDIFLWTQSTGMLTLRNLIVPKPTGTISSYVHINDNVNSKGFGQISGTIQVNGVRTPFILTPIEP